MKISKESLVQLLHVAASQKPENEVKHLCYEDFCELIRAAIELRRIKDVVLGEEANIFVKSSEFDDALKKKQSFNGWRINYGDCDMRLYTEDEVKNLLKEEKQATLFSMQQLRDVIEVMLYNGIKVPSYIEHTDSDGKVVKDSLTIAMILQLHFDSLKKSEVEKAAENIINHITVS